VKKGKAKRRHWMDAYDADRGWAPVWPRSWDPDLDWPRLPHTNGKDRFPVDFTFVTDRVATGGGIWTEADVASLRVAGITHVVTAAEELHATSASLLEGRMPYLLNGVKDDGAWKGAWWFAKTLDFTREALADPNAKVYLHCWSGKNRGPSAAYAVLRDLGYTAGAAESLIRKARPKVILLYRRDADEALERMAT
jgi:dual specificity phosphatase 3